MLQNYINCQKCDSNFKDALQGLCFAAAKEVFGSIRNHSLILAIADFACIAAVRVI